MGMFIFKTIQPKIQNQESQTAEQNEQIAEILEIQDQLSDSVAIAAYDNPNIDGATVVDIMNEKIENIDSEETRKTAEIQKLYLLIEGYYYQEAADEMKKIEAKYPGINEMCDFNIHGYNLAQRTEDEEKKQYYQSRIDKYCPNLRRFE